MLCSSIDQTNNERVRDTVPVAHDTISLSRLLQIKLLLKTTSKLFYTLIANTIYRYSELNLCE